MMKTKKEILDILQSYKKQKGDFYKIASLGLFGSVSREKNDNSSDIDICISFYGAIGFGKLYRIKEELESLMNWSVDLVPLHNNMSESFVKELEKEAIYV